MGILDKIRTKLPTLRQTDNTPYNQLLQSHPYTLQRTNTNIQTYESALENIHVKKCCQVYTDTALSCGYTLDTENIDSDDMTTKNYLERLFSRPEGLTSNLSWSGMIGLIFKSFLVLGDCFLEVSHDYNGVLNGFRYIPNSQIDWDSNRECYSLIEAPDTTYEAGELIHIYEPNTKKGHEHFGISVIDSCASYIALLNNAMRFNNSILENNGLNPSTILSFDPEISDSNFNAEIERLNVQAKQAEQGGLLAIRGATFQNGVTSTKDMSYMELMHLARDNIIEAFGVPPQKAGVIETANLGSGSGNSQNKDWKDTFEGKTRYIEEAFNNCLKENGFNEKFKFNQLDTTDRLLEAQINQIYIDKGVKTIDEVRNELGLDKLQQMSWGDYYR